MAVGWGVVEDTLKAEVERRKENVGKRVTKVNPWKGAVMLFVPRSDCQVLNRRKTHHVPDQPDVDGVAKGIVRLHDYYKFNTTNFVNEGAIQMDDMVHETTGDLTVWDAFKIGVKVGRKVCFRLTNHSAGNKCNDPGLRNPDLGGGTCQGIGRRSYHANIY